MNLKRTCRGKESWHHSQVLISWYFLEHESWRKSETYVPSSGPGQLQEILYSPLYRCPFTLFTHDATSLSSPCVLPYRFCFLRTSSIKSRCFDSKYSGPTSESQ